MNILRRKSTTGSKRGGLSDSALLNDVQDCCSTANQRGKDPDEAAMGRAIARLMETTNRDELDKVIKYLANELKSETHQTVMLTLATTAYLMRTDHPDFQRMLSQSQTLLKNMSTLVEYRRKAGGKTEQHEQADRALALIQSWADTLQGANGTGEILEMYRSLKKKEWVRWPRRIHGYDPVNGPGYARNGVSLDPDAPEAPRKPASLRPSSLRTFSSQETSWLRKDFDQFDQMLNTLENELNGVKNSRELEANALIPDLVAACDRIGPQLRTMIEIVSQTNPDDPDSLTPLLEMNDRFLRLIEQHQKIAATKPVDTDQLDLTFQWDQEEVVQPQVVPQKKPAQPASYNPFEDEQVMSEVFGQESFRHVMATSSPPAPPLSLYKDTRPTAASAPGQKAYFPPPPQRQAPTPLLKTSSQQKMTFHAPPAANAYNGFEQQQDELDLL